MDENLYLIIPFFNFNSCNQRIVNFEKCLKNLQNQSNLKIVIIEGHLKNKSPELQAIVSKYNLIYNYISYELPSILWVKENLINKASELLPKSWEYMAWIDADVVFSSNVMINTDWSTQTVELLKTYDTVQLFKLYAWMHEKGGINVGISFAFISKLDPLDFGHPGYAWAINKNFYNKINGLFEYCIIGGFDGLYSTILKKDAHTFNNNYLNNLGDMVLPYYNKFDNFTYHYVNSTLLHLPHGNLNKRRYNNRYSIFQKYNFDPIKDLSKNNNGILQFKDNQSPIALEIKDYFLQRGD